MRRTSELHPGAERDPRPPPLPPPRHLLPQLWPRRSSRRRCRLRPPGDPRPRPARMTVPLRLEEGLKDSPRFRAAVETVEMEVSVLETHLEKLLKLGGAMLESGRQFCSHSKSFASGIQELSQNSSGDTLMSGCLEKFSQSLNRMMEQQQELLETAQQSLKQQLQTLVKEDIKHFKETRKEFERGSEGLASALHHNAEVPRRRHHEAEDAVVTLKAARTTFRNRALDYVLQILSFMEAQSVFLEHGSQESKQLEEYRKGLAVQLHELVLESAREKRDMEQRHAVIKQKDLTQDDDVPEIQAEPGQVVMEGYLYKRASNAFKTWSRRWFSIQNSQLVYQKKAKDGLTVVVEDLRLCTVKPCPDHERRFCFEVVSPSKSCLLQADSERHLQAWMCAVQSSIASAYNEDYPESPGQPLERSTSLSATLQSPSSRKLRGGVDKQVVDQVQRLEGNAQCCDCREPAPEWASINLGITLCIECSGIHRSLGVHFSKVRSLTLDAWEPELVKLMSVLGNRVINQIYEARVEEMNMKRPQPGSSRSEKEAWIRAKYVERKFITKFPNTGGALSRSREPPRGPERSPRPFPKPKPPGHIRRNTGAREGISPSRATPASEDLRNLHPGALLYRAAAAPPSLPTMADALAHGADVNWVNTAQESRTPLLQAVAANSLLACEFLLQNGANVNQADSKGQGPLHHATILGHTGLACLFLKRGANMNAVDGEGKDPLGIAIDSANADIVTLLRLAQMREAELALGQSGDETYLDIFQDFSFMASNDPEKLSRRAYDLRLTTL
ncbi:arf-GAP with coiled-coil, ANK repeat and PH domain-containing protein 1 isoform X2 [Crotalus tigris]|uniref:arf-GAP with coiled-coil, ANK repeat and PH domain-containing protein 1 isoform X2 n=1 Tax=Crotalus tigris TaxID=88082 RepID=UPI00192F6CC7|nr:arf-GAP with coiled-coil, ANK repeat and PH domain-containing protein 1 isoform X2 [Crotalus tigris]